MLERRGLMGDDEERSLGARETRLRRASDKELTRSAMRSAARYGYFVFDDLATDEAGLIDYLTVGPPDVTVIVVRDQIVCLAIDADAPWRRAEVSSGRHLDSGSGR